MPTSSFRPATCTSSTRTVSTPLRKLTRESSKRATLAVRATVRAPLYLVDAIASGAASLFPEIEQEPPQPQSALVKKDPNVFDDVNNNKNQKPVRYLQYVNDRVNGYSYVPTVYRDAMAIRKHGRSQHGGKGAGGSGHDVPANLYYSCHFFLKDQDDPTDAYHRPPHYCCFVPPFVRRFPGLLEQSWFCRAVGAIGFHSCFKNRHERRQRVFFVGMIFNAIALGLVITASMAASAQNFRLLTHVSLTRGVITVTYFPKNDDTNNITTITTPTATTMSSSTTPVKKRITFDVGYRAVAIYDPDLLLKQGSTTFKEDDDKAKRRVVTFGNFCKSMPNDKNLQLQQQQQQDDILLQFMAQEFCQASSCKTSSQSFIVSNLMNISVIFRNLLNDITRQYPAYDSNFVNFYGSLNATISVILSVVTIFRFRIQCIDTFQVALTSSVSSTTTATAVLFPQQEQDHQDFFANNNDQDDTLPPPPKQPTLEIEWYRGPGLLCIVLATFLKLVDAICNFIVPTPSITRDLDEQEAYERQFGCWKARIKVKTKR